jgi:hypothetical protein
MIKGKDIKRSAFNFLHYTFYERLALDDNRHHDWSPTCDKVAMFRKFATKRLDELSSLYTRIRHDSFLIYVTDSFEDLLMHTHHLICMDESS